MFEFFKKLFGIKRSTTLSDLDNLSLQGVMDKFKQDEFSGDYTFGVKPKSKICKQCGAEMLKYEPEMRLGIRVLHSCSRCDWREYL